MPDEPRVEIVDRPLSLLPSDRAGVRRVTREQLKAEYPRARNPAMPDDIFMFPLPHPHAPGPWGITIPVRVVDRRKMIGRDEALVEPVGGAGQVWIRAERLQAVET